MAILRMENGKIHKYWNAIASHIGGLKVVIDRIPLQNTPTLQEIMRKEVLNDHERQRILETHKHQFKAIQKRDNYQWREIMILHPGSPLLYPLLTQNMPWHTHQQAEGYHILEGECIIGLKHPDGMEMELLLQKEDYIKIPAGVPHWFSLTNSLNLKAIKYSLTVKGSQYQYANSNLY